MTLTHYDWLTGGFSVGRFLPREAGVEAHAPRVLAGGRPFQVASRASNLGA